MTECEHLVVVPAYKKFETMDGRMYGPYCVACGEWNPDNVNLSDLEE